MNNDDVGEIFYDTSRWYVDYDINGKLERSIVITTARNLDSIHIYCDSNLIVMKYYIEESNTYVSNEYVDGVLKMHKVGFVVEGSSYSQAIYNENLELTCISVYVDSSYYYLTEEG